jgi:uncharacterized protein YgbK (DUF1537 family)
MYGERVVVLDDDPTGSQAAAGVRVLLRPDLDAARQWRRGGERALYVVTNTRSLPREQAQALLRDFCAALGGPPGEPGGALTFVLRGDSTLRGHVLAELDCLGARDAVSLWVPAFPEGGRVTDGGTHYLVTDGVRVPVSQTEFARDPVFGYATSYLPDWLAAHAPGRPVRLAGLAAVRGGGLAGLLQDAPPGAIVVPDAETVEDVALIVAGLREAWRAGHRVILRSSSTAAALTAGVYSGGLLPVGQPSPRRTLIVCGSHTAASGRQLARLESALGIEAAVLTARPAGDEDAERDALAARLAADLDASGVALLATERVRPSDLGTLADGAAVMRRLTAVAARLAPLVSACVVKGGISSAEIAGVSFGAVQGMVAGQLEPGVSLWQLAGTAGEIDYVVIPGNMGDDGTMLRCLAAVTSRPGAAGLDGR